MASTGLAILSGLLGGLGQIGRAQTETRERQLKEERGRREERQLEELIRHQKEQERLSALERLVNPEPFQGVFQEAGLPAPTGPQPRATFNDLLQRALALTRERQQGRASEEFGRIMAEAEGRPASLPEVSRAEHELGSPAVPPMTPTQVLARIGPLAPFLPERLFTLAEKAVEPPKPTAVGERGIYIQGQGFLQPPMTRAPFTPPEGARRIPTVKEDTGEVTTRYEPQPWQWELAAGALQDKGWTPEMPGYRQALYGAVRQLVPVASGGAAYTAEQLLAPPPKGPASPIGPAPAGPGSSAPLSPRVERPVSPEDLPRWVHKRTLQPAPATMTDTALRQSGEYVAVPLQTVPKLGNIRTAKAMLESMEEVARRRPDLFPVLTGKSAIDAAAVTQARVKWEAVTSRLSPLYGTDPDAEQFQSNFSGLPGVVRSFGDVGNIAEREQLIQKEAVGLSGARGREAALARLNNIRRLLNEGLRGQGFEPFIPVIPARRHSAPGASSSPGGATLQRWGRDAHGRPIPLP